MTRTDQHVLLGTFAFVILALVSMGIAAPHLMDHFEPLPPLEAPRYEAPEIQPSAPVTPPPVSPGPPIVKVGPKLARRVKHTTTVAGSRMGPCGDDPICGLDLDK